MNPAALRASTEAQARVKRGNAADSEFDALHGGRELLPIEQAIYESEGAERFARFHPTWSEAPRSTT